MVIEHPRPLQLETPLHSAAHIAVAAPRSEPGHRAARRLCGAIQDLGGTAELIPDPDGDILTQAQGPVVVVGNLSDSRCVRGLYYRALCATDLWYPGPGGYELRTLCDPFGTGHNVILVGYSDAAGVDAATQILLSRLSDPIPHLLEVEATRLPMSGQEVDQVRAEPLPPAAWQVANTMLGDQKGYLYYLTGDPALGAQYRSAWESIVECGYEKTEKMVQVHLYSLSRLLPWRLVEHMGLFGEDERLAITRFMYGWAESEEGWPHVMHCPRVVSMHVPRQNHELIPALALTFAAEYFSTHFPSMPGPERWLTAARRAYQPYGPSWKPLCDGLCHGWWASQPVMLQYGLCDPQHAYFEQGGARQAAEYALAVIDNAGWLPSAGDADLRRQFPGPNLRIAAAYFGDGRYRFAHDLAPPDRRLAWLTDVPRAFDDGTEPCVPDDAVGVTVVPVDPLVYDIWERDPQQASGAVTTAPRAPLDSCFDKLCVRTGWHLEDDYLLLDGLGGGSHSYDDAGGIVEYARLGLPLIIQEDSFVHSAPEHHSAVTIVRDGESGAIPAFAELEAQETDAEGQTYLRLRLRDYAGADWVREVHLLPGSCVVVCDTVTAHRAGDYAVEARFRTPARLVLDGREAHCERQSPCAGKVVFRLESPGSASHLSIAEDPVHLRYQDEKNQNLWKERYRTADVVLSALVARQTAHLEPGEGIRLTHLAQVCGPGDAPLHLSATDDGFRLTGDQDSQPLVSRVAFSQAHRGSTPITPSRAIAPVALHHTGSEIRALCPLGDDSLVVGTEAGELTLLDPAGQALWSTSLAGPVHDIGAARGDTDLLAVGHGDCTVTGLDLCGDEIWRTDIEREPCPWPWWELPTPAPVQVAGGRHEGSPFFAGGCGDIQLRCFDGAGQERWRQRHNEGVPGRVRVADADGSGRQQIIVGGDILSDVSTCRILDAEGHILTHLVVEGWTSLLTALALAHIDGRHFIACGSNRGRNLHLFELNEGDQTDERSRPWGRRWVKQLGGRVTGIVISGTNGHLVAGTSQGFLLCYDLAGGLLWSRLLDRGVQSLAPLGAEVLACDSRGNLVSVGWSGDLTVLSSMPGPCSFALPADEGAVLACGSEIVRLSLNV